jgi:hypothetical protein
MAVYLDSKEKEKEKQFNVISLVIQSRIRIIQSMLLAMIKTVLKRYRNSQYKTILFYRTTLAKTVLGINPILKRVVAYY